MSLRDLSLKRGYHSGFDDIINEFYVPSLSNSNEYYRMTGFFSSSSLAVSSIGILGLLKNGGTMKLITSPKLSHEDLEAIHHSKSGGLEAIERKMLQELEEIEDDFIRDHIFALGWMLANKKLEIKIAIPQHNEIPVENGLFHLKIGILKDTEEDCVLFSGSINESFLGWSGKNIEEFKVFRSWVPTEYEYIIDDLDRFQKYWNNEMSPKVEVMEIFDSIKNRLIEIAPRDIDEIYLQKWYKKERKSVDLFEYQNDAIRNWINNDHKGIFEMATGTGKTYTAIGCIDAVTTNKNPFLVIIACPFNHLTQQWKGEIDKFGLNIDELIVADGTNKKWKQELNDACWDLTLGQSALSIVLTTHTTLSSNDFISIIKSQTRSLFKTFLIVDEVHGIGSSKRRAGLLEEYDFRLGLSATPERHFDAVGTDQIYTYFDSVVYQFPLERALTEKNPATGKTYLTPYYYHPTFVSLTEEELETYIEKTKRIAIESSKKSRNDDDDSSMLEQILRERANIIKSAEEKFIQLRAILDTLEQPILHTLIYCSEADRDQIDRTMNILSNYDVRIHRFTMEENPKPSIKYGGISEREFILDKFASGDYNILVAQRCLDEGVDVPPARRAIILASSTNPRQYIQRIGRVIRRYPSKEEAHVYDLIVAPTLKQLPPEIKAIEAQIYGKEMQRAIYIAENSLNSAETLITLYDELRSVKDISNT